MTRRFEFRNPPLKRITGASEGTWSPAVYAEGVSLPSPESRVIERTLGQGAGVFDTLKGFHDGVRKFV